MQSLSSSSIAIMDIALKHMGTHKHHWWGQPSPIEPSNSLGYHVSRTLLRHHYTTMHTSLHSRCDFISKILNLWYIAIALCFILFLYGKAISPTITSFASYILYFELGKFSNERWCHQGRITARTARRPRTLRTSTSCATTSITVSPAIWNDTNSNKGRWCRCQTSGSNNWRWNRNGKSVKMGKTGGARSKRVGKSGRISGPAASCNNGSNLEREMPASWALLFLSLADETGFGHLGQETSRWLDIEQEVLDSEVATKVVNDGGGGREFLANESRRLWSKSTGASAYKG